MNPVSLPANIFSVMPTLGGIYCIVEYILQRQLTRKESVWQELAFLFANNAFKAVSLYPLHF